MAQGYYTLEEAARMLGMSADDLKLVARRGEVRPFQDRGTMRFRVQDIQEMARRRGMGSEPDLPLGDVAGPRPTDSPAPRPKSSLKSPRPQKSSKLSGKSGGTDFSLDIEDDQTDIGRQRPKSGGGKPSSVKGQPPTPAPGSDSDVRLVGADDDFNLEIDSDVKMADTPKPTPPRSSRLGAPRKSGLGGAASPRPSLKKSGLGGPASAGPSSKKSGLGGPRSDPKKTSMGSTASLDSGVRLVPMDSDSDVRIVGAEESNEVALGGAKPPSATDSDIRMESAPERPPASQEGMLTEEINLDEELRKQEASRPPSAPPQAKVRPGAKPAQPQLPTTSPFELSEPELNLPAEDEPVDTSPVEGSSDFDLTPAGESSSPLELGSDEFRLELPDEDVTLGQPRAGLKGSPSGINLDNPIDSGISLEQGGEGSDEIEFELTLDDDSPPKSTPGGPAADSSSEFELTLDADEGKQAEDSDSEFELTLDNQDSSPSEEGAGGPDSEFELTLDPAGEPSVAEDSSSELELEPSAEASSPTDDSESEFELSLDSSGDQAMLSEPGEEGGDIFETDHDLDAGDEPEESGSEAVALNEGDTDLESSDFDIALGDEDVAAEDEESGSQVMALEEEEEDFAAAPKGRRGRRAPALDEEEEPGFEGLAGEEEEAVASSEEAEAAEELAPQPMVVSAPWGALPVVFLLPCVVVMFIVGIMGFELIQGMSGHHEPGLVTSALTKLLMPK